MNFRAVAPEGLSNDALAFSTPFSTEGPCVTLLMDRLKPAVELNPVSAGSLLGHVLAHEMGHVLEGILRHSETGVMKAGWSKREIMLMVKDRLQFTRYDKDLILESFAPPAILRAGDGGKNPFRAEGTVPGGPR